MLNKQKNKNTHNNDNVEESVGTNQSENNTKHSQANFTNGIKNAQNLLEKLEKSIKKSKVYEKRIFQCKATHPHSHEERRPKKFADENKDPSTNRTATQSGTKCSWSQTDLVDKKTNLVVKNLQRQLEEVNNKLSSLAREHAACLSDARAQDVIEDERAQVHQAHHAILQLGERFMHLKRKNHAQRVEYETQIRDLQEALHDVLHVAELARCNLPEERIFDPAPDTEDALAALLIEIRRSNKLSLENNQLKARLRDLLTTRQK